MSLLIQCPACGTSFDLREARSETDWRAFVECLIQFPQDVQSPLLAYLELFRPAKQGQLRSGVLLRLASELLPMVKAQEIKRRHSTYIIHHATWAGGMRHLADSARTLQLPLKGNGYLLETLATRAEKLAAIAEAKQLEAKRNVPQMSGSGLRQAGVVVATALDGVSRDPIHQPYERLPQITEEQAEINRQRIRKMLDDALSSKE